jgi:sugar lactone lactonase YvrE
MKRATVWLWCFLSCAPALGEGQAQGQGQAQQEPPATDLVAPDIPGVVAGGTVVKLLKEGLQGTEGPIALPDGTVIFTEQNADRLVRIDGNDNMSIFLVGTGRSIGLGFDSRGRLVSAQTPHDLRHVGPPGPTKIGIIYPKGSETVLADSFEGKPFASLNDLVIDRKDGIYFSDIGPSANQPASLKSGASPAVYYLAPGGKLLKVISDVAGANGLQLSRDEKILYVNNRSESILAFEIQPDGTVRNRRNFAQYQDGVMAADGLVIDSEGRLYAATATGIQVFSSEGVYLGTIPARAQNLAFAGRDKRTLYIVGRGAAYKVQMRAQGFMGRPK